MARQASDVFTNKPTVKSRRFAQERKLRSSTSQRATPTFKPTSFYETRVTSSTFDRRSIISNVSVQLSSSRCCSSQNFCTRAHPTSERNHDVTVSNLHDRHSGRVPAPASYSLHSTGRGAARLVLRRLSVAVSYLPTGRYHAGPARSRPSHVHGNGRDGRLGGVFAGGRGLGVDAYWRGARRSCQGCLLARADRVRHPRHPDGAVSQGDSAR